MSKWWIQGVAACAVACAGMAWAAEPSGSSGGAPAAQAVPAAPVKAPADAGQRTAQGTIAALTLKAMTPTLQLSTGDGKTLTLTIDPASTSVWQGGRLATLGELKVGETIKVRYVSKDGTDTLKTIQVVQAPAASSGASGAAPAAKTY